MEQIFVESTKSYKHGFLLKEQDIRRVINLIDEQFKKSSDSPVRFNFLVKFNNGAIASTDEIDVVLKLENEGSAAITKLTIESVQELVESKNEIILEFENSDELSRYEHRPIRHIIRGMSRDWVFVTSSLIEERIAKIKKHNILFNPDTRSIWRSITVPLVGVLFLITFMFSVSSNSKFSKNKQLEALKKIENEWKMDHVKDPVDVLLKLENSRLKNSENVVNLSGLLINKPFLVIISIFIISYIFFYAYSKLNPLYNFYWGGYTEIYDKIENRKKILIGIVVFTIILGVAINLLSNYIWQNI